MNKLTPKQVLVASLTLAVILGTGAVYGGQTARAESAAADRAAAVQTTGDPKRSPPDKAGRQDERRGERLPLIEEASAVLNMDQAALTAAWKEKTLVQIAKDKGVSEADLIAALKRQRIKTLDEAVQAGRLKADKAERIKTRMEKHLRFMVNRKAGDFSGGHGGKRRTVLPKPDKLAALLGISEDELRAQLKEGKTLAEIAQVRGISKEQLISKIKEELTPSINEAIERKHGNGKEK